MRLSEIAIADIDRLQHVALQRLTLRVMGETHRILGGYTARLTDWVRSQADRDGEVGASLGQGITEIDRRYRAAIAEWRQLFAAAQWQAVTLPMGAWLVKHNHYMAAVQRALQEDLTAGELGTLIRLWQERRQRAIQVANQRTYSDRLQLSDRIWRLENGGLAQIRGTLAMAMTERTNAVALAKKLESVLGADTDMPRWTRGRLYDMTAAERAKSQGGLLRGAENRSRGVAYNALRLARTELQYANHAITTDIARHSPWVTGRYVRLSPAHPKIDICDEYAGGGPYPVNDEILPLHPQCLCYYEEELMGEAAFVGQVRGWLDGNNDFLDDYAAWVGVRQPTELVIWGLSEADSLELWLGQSGDAHAALLRLAGESGGGQPATVLPPQVGPTGPAVSGALAVPKGGKYAGRYRAALDAIDGVHGDGQLPEIPVNTQSNIEALGRYVSYTNGKPGRIDINGKGDHFELTLAHEVGHFLDQQAIVTPGSFASARTPTMQQWRDAVNQSRAVQQLRFMRQNPGDHTQEIAVGGTSYQVGPNAKYLDYLLESEELWARSYAQYIATRSGNTVMQAQVAAIRSDTLYGSAQWDDDDFASIGGAIDDLFARLGWRK